MRKKSLLAVAICAAALAGLSAGPAFAGEVKGPPGPFTAPDPQFTPVHFGVASSICSFSGLNDYIQGHTSFHVQSYGIDVAGKGEEPFGHPGTGEINCRGGGPAD
jgi:hypothetical protein